jgi:creatinine amidohydrolase
MVAPWNLVGCCALAWALVAGAAVPDTVFVDDLTWTELRDAVAAGKTTVIVPIGGTEQNGPHMALGKHNVRVKALAEQIARALGNALVAPVIAYVPEGNVEPPSAHMRFPSSMPREASGATGSTTSCSSVITAGIRRT